MQNLSAPPSLLLLTSAPQRGGGIGTLYLQALIAGVPDIRVHWHTEQPFLAGQGLARLGKPGALVRSLLVRVPLWSSLRLALFTNLVLPQRLKEVKRLLRQTQTSSILLTTSSPELIALGQQLVARGYDVFAMVLDAPEYLATNLRLQPLAEQRVLHDFSNLMKGVRAAAVISEAMRQDYGENFNIPCEIIRHGSAAVPRTMKTDGTTVKIVFAGSLYSKEEWNAMVRALDLANWQLAGRAVELIFIGRFPLAGAIRPRQMQHIPAVPHLKALELMAEMDIGYLPYWFDQNYAVVARTSFPGKMTAYAAAGLAVFHHGPAYSTITPFLERYPFGLSCSSLEPERICKQLEALVLELKDPAMIAARERAMELELSDTAMATNFRKLLSTKRS